MNRHTLQKLREKENEERDEEEKKEEVTQLIEQQFNISGGQQIIVQKGANPVIHIHADKENLSCETGLSKEDEVLLLPIFKDNIKMLRTFFSEAEGATPPQITAKVNVWIEDGRIRKKRNMKDLWRILNEKGIYTRTYQTWNKQVK